MPVKLSLQINPYNEVPEDDAEFIDGIIEDAIVADQAGMAAVYLTEHHGNHPGNSFVLAGYLARALEQAYVGFCICTVPYHHPQRLAEMSNLLDQLTKGKFIFGIGGGGLALDSATVGIHAADCTQLHDDVFDVVMRLWDKGPDDEPIRYEVGPYSGHLIQRVVPSAYGQDRPHVKLAAIGPRMEKAARYGWSIFGMDRMMASYQDMLVAAGHDAETVERAMEWSSATEIVHCAPTDDEARQWAIDGQKCRGETLQRHLALADEHLGWMRQREMRAPAGGGPGGGGPGPFGSDDEPSPFCTWGSPETLIPKLQAKFDMGVRELSIGFDNGAMVKELRDRTHQSLALFCKEVVPALLDYQPDLERGRELLAAMPPMPFGPPPAASPAADAPGES